MVNVNRRDFLKIIGASACGAFVGCAASTLNSKSGSGPNQRPARFCVPAAEKEDLRRSMPGQSFRLAHPTSVLSLPDISTDFKTYLTLVDETGSDRTAIFTPGLIHSALFYEGQVCLVTRGEPSVIYLIDTHSMQIAQVMRPPQGYVFGGHMVRMPDQQTLALTLNSKTMGQYDAVSFLQLPTFKEIHRIGSYGFQAHDLVYRADSEKMFVGHYGSNFNSGPYWSLTASPLGYSEADGAITETFFPACVTSVDSGSGRLLGRWSHERNGPQGHFAVNRLEQIYLAKHPPLLVPGPDAMTDPAFAEGLDHKDVFSRFQVSSRIAGTTIVVDESSRQFIYPMGSTQQLFFGSFDRPQETHGIDLKTLGNFGTPHGISFHPRGGHYVVSCAGGFMAFSRADHRFIPEKSFSCDVLAHSHFCSG